MPRSHFKLVAKNPNSRGGCLCSPSARLTDCIGPYIAFGDAEMMDVRNPIPVLSCACAHVAVGKAAKRSDAPDSIRPPKIDLIVSDEATPAEIDARLVTLDEVLAKLAELDAE